MTLKRKLAVTTIAASVAMSAFAGIPLSDKGLAEKLGLSGVAYATPYTSQDLITRVTSVYNALTATGGMDEVEALRDAFEALTPSQKSAIAGPIVTKLIPDNDGVKKDRLRDLLIEAINLSYSPSVNDLEEIRVEYADDLQEYATPAGVTDLTVDDVVGYFIDVQDTVMAKLQTMSLNDIYALMSNSDGLNDLLEDVLAALPENDYAVEQVFLHYQVTTEDVIEVLSNVKSEINNNTTFTAAAVALYSAYEYLANPGSGSGNNGGGGGGGVEPTPPTTEIPAEVKELENKLGELKDKLDNASDEEKAELIAEAVKEAQAVLDKLSNIEATVKVEDGKATLELDEKKALSAIAGIAAAAAALKDATGEEIKTQTITIDLGKVEQDDVSFGLSTQVVEEAIKANLDTITFVTDDLKVEVPVGGQINQAVDLTVNRSEANGGAIGGQTPVSGVYDFSANVGGRAVSQFDPPIRVSVPVAVQDADADKLTMFRYESEKVTAVGGRYDKDTGLFGNNRSSFSTYFVAENDVTFNDTAAVEDWAGRAIEVIAAKGAINGKAEGVFDPSANVTRAEFAKMLIHALELESLLAEEDFTDVEDGDWFAPYVASAYEKGIINGRSATKFDPTAKITRAEMATMVTRALKYIYGTANVENLNEALAAFSDAGQISGALAEGVAFAANYGIVVGNEGKFAPNNNASRAQAAVIIYRAYKFED